MNTLIKNALVLPLTAKEDLLYADVAVKDEKIHSIGNVPQDFHPDKTIDATGCIVMPAYVNAHTHLAMILMRNYKDQGNLFQWLSEIFPIEDKLTADDIYAASQLGLAELIRSGTVCFADMYFFAYMTARATEQAGMKANIGFTLFGDIADSRKRLEERMPPLVREIKHEGRILIDPAPHAIYTTSGESFKFAADLAKDLGTRVHLHLSETRKEVEDSIKEFGTTPALYLEKMGFFDTADTYIAHGVHLTEEELAMLETKRTSVTHNPSSNTKLRSGIADLNAIRRHKINIALGTDGASSNNNLNILKELNLAILLNSVSTPGDEKGLSPFDILRIATYGGAKALGRETQMGTLEVGKDADLQIIDMNQVNTTPTNDPYSAIVYSADRQNIRTVMCCGKILMEDHRLTTIDEALAINQTNKMWNALKKR